MTLKTRLIPIVLYKEVGLVKGVGFDSWRRVGGLAQAIRVYNLREVDELIFLDIAATPGGFPPDLQLIDEFADDCFMPLTVGGGIRSVDQVEQVLAAGADKVAINTAAMEEPGLVERIASRFGSQCVVVSIDVRAVASGYEVFTHCGSKSTGVEPVAFAKRLAEAGAGELLVTSVERDGSLAGYDIELTRKIAESVTIPVIAAGGAGSYEDMAQVVLDGGASAVAAASIFHFTQSTPLEAKLHLRERGIPVRIAREPE